MAQGLEWCAIGTIDSATGNPTGKGSYIRANVNNPNIATATVSTTGCNNDTLTTTNVTGASTTFTCTVKNKLIIDLEQEFEDTNNAVPVCFASVEVFDMDTNATLDGAGTPTVVYQPCLTKYGNFSYTTYTKTSTSGGGGYEQRQYVINAEQKNGFNFIMHGTPTSAPAAAITEAKALCGLTTDY